MNLTLNNCIRTNELENGDVWWCRGEDERSDKSKQTGRKRMKDEGVGRRRRRQLNEMRIEAEKRAQSKSFETSEEGLTEVLGLGLSLTVCLAT
jgi:hypothetical protein